MGYTKSPTANNIPESVNVAHAVQDFFLDFIFSASLGVISNLHMVGTLITEKKEKEVNGGRENVWW